MKYTFQEWSESGSFANPAGDELAHVNKKSELDRALDVWEWSHERVGSDPRDAFLMVWKGKIHDVTDRYPDFLITRGPRGGMKKEMV